MRHRLPTSPHRTHVASPSLTTASWLLPAALLIIALLIIAMLSIQVGASLAKSLSGRWV